MGSKSPKGKSLAEVNPDLAKEWHPSKNGILNPEVVTAGSDKKVWWKCLKNEEHIWLSKISSRKFNGCPICSNRKINSKNSLEHLAPNLAKEWHPSKNGALKPSDVGTGSNKRVWWKCDKGPDHEWEVLINSRYHFNSGCPFCSGRRVSKTNCLETINPELTKQWHPVKNGNITPRDVVSQSNKKYWWKCDKGADHEWETSINNRKGGNRGCPVCSGRKTVETNSLAKLNPELTQQWHQTKNGNLTPSDFGIGSSKKVWWQCEKAKDHTWLATIYSRQNAGCPFCSGNKLITSNSLAYKHPEIAKQWHPTKNSNILPEDVYAGGRKIWWWKCDKGPDHEWQANLDNRIRQKQGCPFCCGQKISYSNSLLSKYPSIAEQWHPTKNGDNLPKDVYSGGTKKWWWKCNKGPDHEWRANLDNRIRQKQGCPFCTLTPQSKQELKITFELKLFFDIDPKGFKTRINGKLWSIDIYLKEINLGIEFDGSYWHKDQGDFDKLKTQKLKEDGFQIMRIREEPLKPITDIDVVSKRPFNAKQVANDILTHIIQAFDLDKERVQKISKYLKQKDLKNEKALDEYIEMILDEKSEKKQKRTTTAPKPH